MSETKFTPGPWRAVREFDEVWSSWSIGKYAEQPFDDLVFEICKTDHTYGSPAGQITEFAANAHLIAAAPKLYEVLRHLGKHAKLTKAHRDYAEAALAKARGES